jgi:Cu(I)/Ag(I) efflux system membrane fusion protein|tara:strand:- start:35217 stop:36662 length:1446 start_codon:yes stop_codon:yes gene_type:complete
MNKVWKLVLLVGIIAISVYFGTLIPSKQSVESQPIVKAEKKPLFYRNPMNPEITSPTPAKDHMGMDYIPVYADDGDKAKSPAGTVKIDPVVVQNIGVRTAVAKKKSFGRSIRTVGRIEFDEERMVNLHPKVEGWVDEIYVDKTGQQVKEDTILLSIYSPILVTAQQEYLLALNNLKNLKGSTFSDVRRGAEQLVESSRQRLELLDVPEHQIQELEQSRKVKKNLHIHSPFAGTVVNIGAREGQYVTPKTELYMIVDLSQVWVYADIYEYEIPWVKVGDEVDMTLTSVPGKTFKGKVVYIYPYAEAKTRTTKVRIVFENKDNILRPNMFADVAVKAQSMNNVIVIPSEAVVRSGKKEQVFIVREPGKYEPRVVKLGIESNGEVAVLSGLQPGEEIVTSAQFLVDSESKLREAAAKMMESKQTSEQDHSNMDHGTMDEQDSNKNHIDHSQMNHDNMNDNKASQDKIDHSKMNHAPMNGEHVHD